MQSRSPSSFTEISEHQAKVNKTDPLTPHFPRPFRLPQAGVKRARRVNGFLQAMRVSRSTLETIQSFPGNGPSSLRRMNGREWERHAADSVQKRDEVRTVSIGDSREFQPQPVTWNQITHFSLDPDVPFLDEEIKLSFDAHGLRSWRGEKQPANTEIGDSRNIFGSAAPPAGPDTVLDFESKSLPSGEARFCQRGRHIPPRALKSRPGRRGCNHTAPELIQNIIRWRRTSYQGNTLKIRQDLPAVRSLAPRQLQPTVGI